MNYGLLLLLAVPVAGFAWLIASFLRSAKDGDEVLKLAQENPDLIERLELHDGGDPVYLSIKLSGRKATSILGLSAVECVRLFDKFKASVSPNVVCSVVNAARPTAG